MKEESKLVYLVVLKKKTVKSPDEFFVVTTMRRDEFGSPAVFHGVGFWSDKKPTKIKNQQIIEVWIPWERIDHVESLMYRQRS